MMFRSSSRIIAILYESVELSIFLRSFVCFVFQVQAVGLQAAYRLDPDIRRLMQCLLALPLLPAREIPLTFSAIHERAPTLGEETKTLVEYFVGVWISTRSRQATWEPTQWSQYQQAIRTNNNAEGWHRRLNTRAGHASLNFYHLLELLHHDSRLLAVQVSLLSTFNAANAGKLNGLWGRYFSGELDGMQLLKRCRKMQRPPM